MQVYHACIHDYYHLRINVPEHFLMISKEVINYTNSQGHIFVVVWDNIIKR